jgi:signal peptidase I
MSPKIGQRSGARSAFGQLLRGVIGVFITLLVVRSWFVEPFIVPSGSMAPTLLGVHADLPCRRCGSRFAYGLDDGATSRVVCPNCGHVQIEESDPLGLDGDRVLVDRSAFRWRQPRRWEPVAFRSPTRPRDIVVKRVAGLPGETIEIRDGDVYADGRIQRKSPAEQQAVAIPVYDTAFVPSVAAEYRWVYPVPLGQWERRNGRFVQNDASSVPSASRDWLTYHHQQLTPGSSAETIEAPVKDICGYNQTQSRRELYPMRDLALQFQLQAIGAGMIFVSATDGEFEFLVRLDLGLKQLELLRDGTSVALIPCEFPRAASGAQFYISLFDQQVSVAWNDKLLISYAYERPPHARPASSRPFRIASERLVEISVWDLRITRDVYYTPPEYQQASTRRLGPDEYFVLGDNSPESHDSRWTDFGPSVPGQLLIGKPFVVYYPAQLMHAWGRSFQFPEFSNIRYIR